MTHALALGLAVSLAFNVVLVLRLRVCIRKRTHWKLLAQEHMRLGLGWKHRYMYLRNEAERIAQRRKAGV